MDKIFRYPLILVTLLVIIPCTVLMFIFSNSPLYSIYTFFHGPFSNLYNFGNMLNRSAPLILSSLGAFIALRSNSFNLGGEGQVLLGATVTGILAANMKLQPSILSLTIIILSALLASGFITWISAWLESRYNISSLITTYLISMTVIHICRYYITNPFLKRGSNILTTDTIPEYYQLSQILPPSNLTTGFIISIVITIIITIFLKNTIWGFEFTLTGRNKVFSSSMGINSKIYKILGMTFSGMLHGAAGAILVIGNHHSVIDGFHNGLGWNGLASGLLAGANPIMVIPTSLLYSYLDSGSSYSTITSDVSLELSSIIKGILFFVISSRVIKEKLISRRKP